MRFCWVSYDDHFGIISNFEAIDRKKSTLRILKLVDHGGVIWHGAAVRDPPISPRSPVIFSMTPLSISIPLQREEVWTKLRREAEEVGARETDLLPLLSAVVLERQSFSDALAHLLGGHIETPLFDAARLRKLISQSHTHDPNIVHAAMSDLHAVTERDPAATSPLLPFLFFKGFHALQLYRVAHWLWNNDQKNTALYFQSAVSRSFTIDIHPAAKIGEGIMMDHGHGIVIGETAVVEDHVSFLHNVTLGGTYKIRGDRHPKIRSGVMLGAGAKVLGNVEIGKGTRVAPGTVVVKDVPAGVTVAGVPARIVGSAGSASPAREMDQLFGDEGSSI